MSIEVAQVRVGACYRAGHDELRQVRAMENDEVTFVVIRHAPHRTCVGPLERMPVDRFAREAERDEPWP
ncbi:MAG: hypothetical protein KF889_18270 [Alphaproteobacteria bacterium]|nr:hypothetical protein [Alphaproteobacteria bacterium]MCW5743986.1 hypothetical protein [Alphaproteobacteria bacterium]